VTDLNGNFVSLTFGDAMSSLGLAIVISIAALLLYAKASNGRTALSGRRGVAVIALGIAFMFISLLSAQNVLEVDYEAVNYGYPLPWLVHYISGIVPVNLWLPNFVGITVDYLVYLAASAVVVSLISIMRSRRQASLPR